MRSRLPVLLVLVLLAGTAAAAETAPAAGNHLAGEKSPYLQSHASNPVDWYPWGPAAFAKARAENKLIFLSIGYSTCHWCHVMARESFEDPAMAAVLNARFVCVKVDREERPDVDRIYMTFVQATTGAGGWPLTVWLTPDLKPVFGGTYFAPASAAGRPGLKDLAVRLAEKWQDSPAELTGQAAEVWTALEEEARAAQPAGTPAIAALRRRGLAQAEGSFDARHGGFEGAPKFPNAVILDFLLDEAATGPDAPRREAALKMAVQTLRAMAAGGIHDQLGGGFHRYATDEAWLVPHFEKMLADQAQLTGTYLSAWQRTGDPVLRAAAVDTLAYVAAQLTDPAGGFRTAEDADSATATGHAEGAFYVWTTAEIAQALGPDDAALFAFAYGVRPEGNTGAAPGTELAGRNVLHRVHTAAECAQRFKRPEAEVAARLASAAARLRTARDQRPRPPCDDKVVTACNGLMISAYARAAQALAEPAYAATAARAAAFLRAQLRDPATGRLAHTWRAGRRDDRGFAEDYAFLIQGLLDLYEATFDPATLQWAVELQEIQDALFLDSAGGGYFASAAGDPAVLLRLKGADDGAEPSPNSVSIRNLARLAAMLHRDTWRERAAQTGRAFTAALERAPFALPEMLAALGWLEGSPQQVLIAGGAGDARTAALEREAWRQPGPRRVLLRIDAASRPWLESQVAFIRALPAGADQPPTAYVCENFACRLPVTDPAALARQLSPGKK